MNSCRLRNASSTEAFGCPRASEVDLEGMPGIGVSLPFPKQGIVPANPGFRLRIAPRQDRDSTSRHARFCPAAYTGYSHWGKATRHFSTTSRSAAYEITRRAERYARHSG